MNNKPMWVMHVPVISTQHMPSSYTLKLHTESVCATYPEGGFLYLPDDPVDSAWTEPVLVWLRKHFGDDTNWVRFDVDADVVEGLTVYEWSEA